MSAAGYAVELSAKGTGRRSLTSERRDLVAANLDLVGTAVARLLRAGVLRRGRDDGDDALGEGYLALCLAALGFEPSGGVPFVVYARKSIWHHLRYRHRTAGVIRAPEPEHAKDPEAARRAGCVASLTARVRQGQGLPDRPHQEGADPEEVERLYCALGRLEREDGRAARVVRRRYFQGQNCCEIARKEAGVGTRQNVSIISQGAVKELRRLLTWAMRRRPDAATV